MIVIFSFRNLLTIIIVLHLRIRVKVNQIKLIGPTFKGLT